MRHTRTAMTGVWVVATLVVLPMVVKQELEEHHGKDMPVLRTGYAHPQSVAFAQEHDRGGTSSAVTEHSTEEKGSQKALNDTPSQSKEGGDPLPNFVPTEKIRVDNAVDFPADI